MVTTPELVEVPYDAIMVADDSIIVESNGIRVNPALLGIGFLHTQATPALVWTVPHELGQTVVSASAIYSTDYQTQYFNVILEPLDENNCKLYFSEPVSGYALIQR